jgi:hypothetical protein
MRVCGREIRVHGHLLRVARLEAEKYKFLDDPETLLKGLRECGTRIDLFTFMQRLPESTPKYDYPMEWDNLAAVTVTSFEHWWEKQIGFKARNKARQAAKKGVVIREVPFNEALVKGIWEVYNECPVRQGRRFSHYGKDIDTVYREEATLLDSSIFIGAYLDGTLIGFIKLVQDQTRTQAGLMNIISMIRHRDKAPTNALVAQAVRSCAERGISYLVYSNYSYGDREKDTVRDFKQRNAFQHIDLPRYYVPMTVLGSTAFQLGLHKRFADRVPEPVVAKLRQIRNRWYNRKLESAVYVS